MANVYYKILNQNIRTDYTEHIISGIQKELYNSARVLNEDIFDLSKGMTTQRAGLSVDSLLKYYIINQLLKNMPPETNKVKNISPQYLKTANKKYRKDPHKDIYYIRLNDKWTVAENVMQVNDDGSYILSERKTHSLFEYRYVYNVDDVLISVQLINPDGQVVHNKMQAAELMNLRQEYVLKHKYSGYSGNSNDIIADILNRFSKPQETGYYMDNHYNLFKWHSRDCCFMRLSQTQSPLLIDYDFGQSRKVIKKEYTGIK